jgi:hypothetical protein
VRAAFAPLESYLGFALDPEAAWVPAEAARVTRTKSCGDWRNWMTPSDVEFFRPHFAAFLAHNDYVDDWTLSQEPRIPPEHGSDYVLRLVDERRSLQAAGATSPTEDEHGLSPR